MCIRDRDNTQRVMHYRNVFPRNRVFGWEQIGRFRPSQYLLMHSVIYRTQLLRDCGLELPKHTFYAVSYTHLATCGPEERS